MLITAIVTEDHYSITTDYKLVSLVGLILELQYYRLLLSDEAPSLNGSNNDKSAWYSSSSQSQELHREEEPILMCAACLTVAVWDTRVTSI